MAVPRIFAFALLLWGSASLASAQEDSSQAPSPRPPSLSSLTGDYSLVKKFTYLPPPPPAPGTPPPPPDAFVTGANKPVEVHAELVGGIRRSLQKFVDGSTCEIWGVQSYRFTTYSAHPESVILNVVSNTNDPTAPNQYRDAADFPELAWLPQAGFQGTKMRGDVNCNLFKSGDQVAWIEIASNRPIYFESKAVQVSYAWSSPPAGLQLPSGYVDKLQKFKRAQRGQM